MTFETFCLLQRARIAVFLRTAVYEARRQEIVREQRAGTWRLYDEVEESVLRFSSRGGRSAQEVAQ